MYDIARARKMVFALVWTSALLLTGAGVWLEQRLTRESNALPRPASDFQAPRAVEASLPPSDVWARPGAEELSAEVKHYQLAGTFLTYAFLTGDGAGNPQSSLALVDDLRTGRQLMLREKDSLGAFVVQHIGMDQLTLEREGQTWVLSLPGLLARRSAGVSSAEAAPTGPSRFEDMPALETTPFGKRIAENQWVIQRQAILDYTGDLLRDPRRTVGLYQSFTQTATSAEEAHGFRVQMKGEQEFLTAMGLGDGDVIRKVNSMEMKNEARAEYLVSEFMKERMSAVVLDIERDGREEKRIYIIR
jgi:type II secretory pathway component PulC